MKQSPWNPNCWIMTSTEALEQQTRLGAPPEVLAVLTALADAEAISTPTDRPTDA